MAGDLDADVLVVGGGLAGYGAAHRLAARGHTVRVLEREAEPGGRIRTVHWRDATLELGAMWFNHGYRRLTGLLDELDLSGRTTGLGDLAVRIRRGDRWHELDFGRPSTLLTTSLLTWRDRLSLARWVAGMARIAPTLRRAEFGDLDPVADLDTRSVVDVLTPGARRLLSVLEASLGYRPQDMSYALICGMFGPAMLSPGLARPITLQGGLGTLVEGLGARVGTECSVTVERVQDRGGGRVEVHGRDAGGGPVRRTARAVVLATPADVTARIWPGCPPRLTAFLRRVRYSSCTLLYLRTATPYAPVTRRGTPVLQEVVPAEDRPADAASGLAVLNRWVPSGGLLMTGNTAAAGGRTVADRLQADVEAYHPELRGQVVDRLAHRRTHFAPLFETGYLRRLAALRPELRPAAVDVAGDYLRAPSLEGALASGLEAADRVRARLGDDRPG
jgi:protoporphyrinogen/coproporphyrinogen III oxidase